MAMKATHLVRPTKILETLVQVFEGLHRVLTMLLRLVRIRDNLRVLSLLPS